MSTWFMNNPLLQIAPCRGNCRHAGIKDVPQAKSHATDGRDQTDTSQSIGYHAENGRKNELA